MPLPKAVAKQIKESNALHKAMYGETAPAMLQEAAPGAVIRAINAPEPAPEPAPAASPTDAPEAPPDVAEADAPLPEQHTEQSPVGQPVPEDAEPAPDSETTWEQRYKSYKGVYDKQLAELRRENKLLERQLQGQQAIIDAMKDTSTTPQPAPEPVPAKGLGSGFIKKEDYDTFGPDLIDVAMRAAREAVDADFAALRRENQKLTERLSGVSSQVASSSEDQFHYQLQALVPNYQELMQDALFLQWLDGIADYNRKQRGALLREAFNAFDAQWAASIFQKYLTESNAIRPQPTPAPRQAPKQGLEAYVAPGKPKAAVQSAGAGAAAGDEDQRVYTEADIKRAYDDKRRGKWRGRDNEWRKEEARIHRAAMEGRIVP